MDTPTQDPAPTEETIYEAAFRAVRAARPLTHQETADYYTELAAQAEDAAREREALTDALAEVGGFIDAARYHAYGTAHPDARQTTDALIQCLRYLRTAVANLGERVARLEGGR